MVFVEHVLSVTQWCGLVVCPERPFRRAERGTSPEPHAGPGAAPSTALWPYSPISYIGSGRGVEQLREAAAAQHGAQTEAAAGRGCVADGLRRQVLSLRVPMSLSLEEAHVFFDRRPGLSVLSASRVVPSRRNRPADNKERSKRSRNEDQLAAGKRARLDRDSSDSESVSDDRQHVEVRCEVGTAPAGLPSDCGADDDFLKF